jgi:hypothetical protein
LGSNKVTDEKLRQVIEAVPPVTLPPRAHGPQELEWEPVGEQPPVWIWVQWPDRVAEQVPGFVVASNDRVCVVRFETDRGTRQVTVWRPAVRRRSPQLRGSATA